MDANQRKGLRRREKLARRKRRTHNQAGARGPSKSDSLRALEITFGVARDYRGHRGMQSRRAMHHHDGPRCSDCGTVIRPVPEPQPNAEGLTELSLDQRYPPMVAMLLTEVIERNPPPDRRIDFLGGGRFIQWTDAKGELHKLDTDPDAGGVDDMEDDDLEDDATPLQAVDLEQLADVLSKRGQA